MSSYDCYFFFQAEDGIRARTVTGVQTCALPISVPASSRTRSRDRSPSRGPGRAPPVQQGEHRRDEHEGGDGGEIGRASCRERVEVERGAAERKKKVKQVSGRRERARHVTDFVDE